MTGRQRRPKQKLWARYRVPSWYWRAMCHHSFFWPVGHHWSV